MITAGLALFILGDLPMPYEAKQSDQCPASKPWGVFNKNTGKLHGCHDSQDSAMEQMKALYANENNSLRERRFVSPISMEGPAYVANVELRAETDENQRRFLHGYSAVFNQRSELLADFIGAFREIILPGAFSKTIQNADVRALFNHDPNYPLGRTKAGTLSLKEDDVGLYVEVDLPSTSYANDLFTSIKRGDVNQMSFGFTIPPGGDDWRMDREEGIDIREIREVELFDVSPVVFPAYPQTEVGAEMRRLFVAQHTREKRPEEKRPPEEKKSEPLLTYGDILKSAKIAALSTEEEKELARRRERVKFITERSDPASLREILRTSRK